MRALPTGLSGTQAAVFVLVRRAASWCVELCERCWKNKAPEIPEETEW